MKTSTASAASVSPRLPSFGTRRAPAARWAASTSVFPGKSFRPTTVISTGRCVIEPEPIFAAGSMLGVTDCFAVLDILDVVEQMGLDVVETTPGWPLAWATEALEKGVVTEKETLLPLKFGQHQTYQEAVRHLAFGVNDFYRLLGQGTLKAATHYGGADFACVLGQEMAGYATGEVYFASQALGLAALPPGHGWLRLRSEARGQGCWARPWTF